MNTNSYNGIPKSLKIWFIIHFAVDILFAIPLFIIPGTVMKILGWTTYDPVTTRMVAAALFGIGGESLLSIRLGRDAFEAMLSLKIIWSAAAVAGFIIALYQNLFNSIAAGILLLFIFLFFSIVWIYFYRRIRRISSND